MSDNKAVGGDTTSGRAPGGRKLPISQTNNADFFTEQLKIASAAGGPAEIFEQMAAGLIARTDRVKEILRAVGCSGDLDDPYRYAESLRDVLQELGYSNPEQLTDDQKWSTLDRAYKTGRLKGAQLSAPNPRQTKRGDDHARRVTKVKEIARKKHLDASGLAAMLNVGRSTWFAYKKRQFEGPKSVSTETKLAIDRSIDALSD
jgi:hypothetical protein